MPHLTESEKTLIDTAYRYAHRGVCTGRMLARHMGWQETTTRTRLSEIYRKLGIHSMVELCVLVYQTKERSRQHDRIRIVPPPGAVQANQPRRPLG